MDYQVLHQNHISISNQNGNVKKMVILNVHMSALIEINVNYMSQNSFRS